jgi:hypothetical protein
MCADFRAGGDVVNIEIGDRTGGDVVSHPADGLHATMQGGTWRFTRKDGAPYWPLAGSE